MAQEVDVDKAGPAARRERGDGELRSLYHQAQLVAIVCLLVDAALFADATPRLAPGLRLAALALIAGVDAALALPPKYSGPLAGAHAVAAVCLALVLPATPNADWGLAGGFIAAYRAGAWMRRKSSLAALLALSGAAAIGGLIALAPSALTIWTAIALNAFIPWLVGRYTSARRRYTEELRHNRELELRDATAATERAANKQRQAIARDLHDVISHHVSAIAVHSGAVRLKLSARPECAQADVIDSLMAVEASSRSALLDLRRVLDVLHETADSANQVGLGHLGQLLEGVRRSGLAVRFQVAGRPRELPGSLDQALYRMAQEMLTNALRHGDGAPVQVDLRFKGDSVQLSARNGIGPEADRQARSPGRGLAGISNRVALFGGSVCHGPSDDGQTWETRVDLPINGPEETP
ncbi:MAG: histidine kinase [Bifidobacteriaceae bacterium]|jgi:signal transduction histidine kinase|nr:histidine kinase [Bifidobacteriaceae bacterium]